MLWCRFRYAVVLQKKKAGPLDAYKLTLKALSTFQVHYSPSIFFWKGKPNTLVLAIMTHVEM